MFKLVFALLCLTSLAYADQGVNWALLVAGSNEYYNYRHQADICHAYQILHKYGIPDERIVVMMYDDIANNDENPFKGNIINKPKGPNVYSGVLKDYTGALVTPDNFLNVLQGNSEAMHGIGSGKVINSGPNDNVFVYFADHGAPGLVAFPDGSVLQATDLNNAIKSMYSNNKYANMLVYIEACESGSMFDQLLPNNINVYATTAANTNESSYGCYYDEKRQIQYCVFLETYLGDVYSVNWMEDSDAEDITKETLKKQYQIVQKHTKDSHVMQYGNLSMSVVFNVGQFQGESSFLKNMPLRHRTGLRVNPNIGAVKTEDVRMTILEKKLEKETDNAKVDDLQKQIAALKQHKSRTVGIFRQIVSYIANRDVEYMNKILESKSKLTNHVCYRPVIDHLLEKCFSSKNEYALRNFYQMVNLCEDGVKAEQIKFAIDKICRKRMDDY